MTTKIIFLFFRNTKNFTHKNSTVYGLFFSKITLRNPDIPLRQFLINSVEEIHPRVEIICLSLVTESKLCLSKLQNRLKIPKALVGLRGQLESIQTAENTTARHSGGSVETYYCPADVQNFLLTYSDVSILSSGDLLSLSLAISLARQKTASATAAVIEHLKFVQDPDFDAHLFDI